MNPKRFNFLLDKPFAVVYKTARASTFSLLEEVMTEGAMRQKFRLIQGRTLSERFGRPLTQRVLWVTLATSMLIGLTVLPAVGANPTGTIVGTVTDSSGAIIPDATVTVTNQGTAESRTMKTNVSGDFNFPILAVGNYTLKVEKEGFQVFLQKNIVLQVDQNITLPVVLQVGNVSQEVTVTGTTAGVNLVNATMSDVVDSERMVDLPLNGRDPLQLEFINPGVVYDTNNVGEGTGQRNGVVVNGNRPASNNYLLDGVSMMDVEMLTPIPYPSPDALQEFSILTSEFDADYGVSSGAQVNSVTKSGTNRFHGSAFEFVRNDILNASTFFSNEAGVTKPPFKLNQYGGTFGGPIRKDKTFFFGYFQETNSRKSESDAIPNVLTASERPTSSGADFSDVCPGTKCPIDPTTGSPFPNNIIPANRLDPTAVKLINVIMPSPNSGRSYVFAAPFAGNNDYLDEPQFIGRIDHYINDNNKIFGRYYYNHDTSQGLGLYGTNTPGNPFNLVYRNQNLALNYTHTISPTMLNTLTLGMNRETHLRGPEKNGGWEDFGGLCNSAGCGRTDIKRTLFAYVGGSINSEGPGSFGENRLTTQYSDTLSWIKGKHAIKIGADYVREANNEFTDYYTDPYISFNGQFSGNSLSDLLLGLPNYARQDSRWKHELRRTAPDAFATDTIKVSRNFSVDLGIRWEPYLPVVDNLNQFICWDPTYTKHSTFYPTAPPGLLFPGSPINSGFGQGDSGCPRTMVPDRWANFGPRIGLVWDPFKKGKTAVRAGYGVFWDKTLRMIGLNRFMTSQPYGISRSEYSPGNASNNFAPSLSSNLIYVNSGTVDPYPFLSPPRTQQERAAYQWDPPALENVMDPNFNNAYVQQRTLSIDQELWHNYTLTIAYIGNKSTHMWTSNQLNPAIALPLSVMSAANQRTNTDARRRLSAIQCPSLGGTGTLPCYGSVEIESNEPWSNFDSLQVTMNRKMGHGLTFLGSYVWSKYIDVTSWGTEGANVFRDPQNLNLDKGLSDNDVASRFEISYIWELPKTRHTGLLGALANGWEVNGITSIQDGTTFTVFSGIDTSLSGENRDHADAVAGQSTTLPSGRPRAQFTNEYFNTSAFQIAAVPSFGNVGRDTLRGPGIINFDFSIFKDFKLGERWGKMEFRDENFNIFNRPNFLNPDSSVNDGPGVFGHIFTTRDPRFIQFALKWIF